MLCATGTVTISEMGTPFMDLLEGTGSQLKLTL